MKKVTASRKQAAEVFNIIKVLINENKGNHLRTVISVLEATDQVELLKTVSMQYLARCGLTNNVINWLWNNQISYIEFEDELWSILTKVKMNNNQRAATELLDSPMVAYSLIDKINEELANRMNMGYKKLG